MNVSTPRPVQATVIAPPRPEPRVRAFGVGYGASSGYARRRGYARSSMNARFRLA